MLPEVPQAWPQIEARLATASVHFLPHHHVLLKNSDYWAPYFLPCQKLLEELLDIFLLAYNH